MRLRRRLVLLLASALALPALSAKKAQPVLEWKSGILWASPDPCYDDEGVFSRESFLIVADESFTTCRTVF